MYVVYENPLPMLADDPSAYRGQPELPFLREVPTTWDETRALAGEVGRFIVVARRKGDAWYLGAMNGMAPRQIDVRLDFLGAGEYQAETYADGPAGPSTTERSNRVVRAGDTVHLSMSEAGGQAIRLTPRDGQKPG
jgi:alpha-glucosidase